VRIPKTHPRYESLVRRETLARAWKDGIVVPEGLIAHGRGEAFDYLFGEETSAPALVAEKAAAAALLRASRPVISVNGNVAALAALDVPATIEVNLFHRTEERVRKIVQVLDRAGTVRVLGRRPDARIPGLDSRRALCHREGIYKADVVLVPLEDGDRAEALVAMGKTVISVDLNPMSRTSRRASIPVVDDVTRALRNIERFARELRGDPEETSRILNAYRRVGNLRAAHSVLAWRLERFSKRRGARRRKRGARKRA